MEWVVGTSECEAVQQCAGVVQRNHFVAVAAGVFIGQHTRVLVANLHRCGGGLSAKGHGVGAGVQQLAAGLAAAHKEAAVGPAALQQVVVELSSGPQGAATIDRRVAGANVRVAKAVCTRAVCPEALTKIRGQSGQSRLAERAALVEEQAAAVGGAKAAGPAGPQLQSSHSSAAQADGLVVGMARGDKRRTEGGRGVGGERRRQRPIHIWATSPPAKVCFMDSQSLSQSLNPGQPIVPIGTASKMSS